MAIHDAHPSLHHAVLRLLPRGEAAASGEGARLRGDRRRLRSREARRDDRPRARAGAPCRRSSSTGAMWEAMTSLPCSSARASSTTGWPIANAPVETLADAERDMSASRRTSASAPRWCSSARAAPLPPICERAEALIRRAAQAGAVYVQTPENTAIMELEPKLRARSGRDRGEQRPAQAAPRACRGARHFSSYRLARHQARSRPASPTAPI